MVQLYYAAIMKSLRQLLDIQTGATITDSVKVNGASNGGQTVVVKFWCWKRFNNWCY